METSQLTGISRGRFDDLRIKRDGAYQEINSVLDGIGGGAGVDLSNYYTQAGGSGCRDRNGAKR